MTEAEYLASESLATEKHELINGEIVAMAGASYAHVKICANVIRALGDRLRSRPCDVLSTDLRVCVSATGLYTYPDVFIICGPPEFHSTAPDTVMNPVVICEVLSPSTEAYDRGAKFAHYQNLSSLREYVLVAQDQRRVERFFRVDGGWLYTLFANDTVLPLAAIDVELPLYEVYDRVDLVPPEPVAESSAS